MAADFPTGWDLVAETAVKDLQAGLPDFFMSPQGNALLLAKAQARMQATAAQVALAQAHFQLFGNPGQTVQPTANGNVEEAGSIAPFLHQIRVVQAQVAALEDSLQQSAPNTAAAVNNALNAALAKLYQLAVFVRGDYDARIMSNQVDEAQKTALLESVLASFMEVKVASEKGFTDLSQIHVKVVELRNGTVLPLKDRAAQTAEQTRVKIEGMNRTIRETNSSVEQIQQSMNQANDSMRTLQDRKNSAEQAATATDVGLGILTLGIWNLAGAIDSSKSPSAVIGLQNDINDLQNNINNLGANLASNVARLASLQAQRAQIEQAAASQQLALAQFPGIERSLDENIQRLDGLTSKLAVLKDVSAQLFSRMTQLHNEALSAAHESFLKKEFADAILDMCFLGAIDRPRLAEVNLILTELTTEYGPKGLSRELQDKVNAATARIKDIEAHGDVAALAG